MSWLWKGDTNSPASFEKALSKLSTQITAANLALDTSRSRGRRLKALWTLYTTLTYLLYTLVLVLVLGPQNWSWPHYGGLLGAPAVIYGVREAVAVFYDWTTSRQQAHVDQLQKQRDDKIADLKKATKYDSTQELLQKYGGASNQSPSKQSSQSRKPKSDVPKIQPPVPQRTGMAPPPTANIPGRNVSSPPPPFAPNAELTPLVTGPGQVPQHGQSPMSAMSAMSASQMQSPVLVSPDSPGFAPNAFTNLPPASEYDQGPHWYDRILDVLLGEDETSAKNRIVLLCSGCRLVNGQAPPGVRTLEEIGKWRCSSCGAWNGVESEGTKVVKQMAQRQRAEAADEWEKVPHSAVAPAVQEEELEDQTEEDPRPVPAQQGATGREEEDSTKVTRRTTRSAGKAQSPESPE